MSDLSTTIKPDDYYKVLGSLLIEYRSMKRSENRRWLCFDSLGDLTAIRNHTDPDLNGLEAMPIHTDECGFYTFLSTP